MADVDDGFDTWQRTTLHIEILILSFISASCALITMGTIAFFPDLRYSPPVACYPVFLTYLPTHSPTRHQVQDSLEDGL